MEKNYLICRLNIGFIIFFTFSGNCKCFHSVADPDVPKYGVQTRHCR
jgi:hypothetical protein